MKSLKDYSLKLTEEQYHAYPAWSYSTISRYAKEGFSSIATIHESVTPTPSMEFGSLFDCLITDADHVSDRYVVLDTVPPPAEKNVLDTLSKMTNKPFDLIPDATIQEAIAQCSYQGRLKYETQLVKLSAYKDYYNTLSEGKKIVSSTDMNDAVAMAGAFLENPYIKSLWTSTSSGIEHLYQLKFAAKAKLTDGRVVSVKCMPDKLVVDHNEKTIQPIDVKTSAMPAYDFVENFVKFRYDIQASLYTNILRIVLNAHDEYKDYTILPYVFCDISRTDMQPVSYVYDPCSEDQIDGFSFKEYKYKGWKELLSEILDYEAAKAVVPKGILTDEANDLISILNSK
jgi:hypothetical protein